MFEQGKNNKDTIVLCLSSKKNTNLFHLYFEIYISKYKNYIVK